MPPTENTNKNVPSFNAPKIELDSIFKKNNGQVSTPSAQNIPSDVFGVLNNQKYTPSQTPIANNTIPNPVNNPAQKSIVRTYKSDVESAISANHLSSINIAIAENEKKHEQIKADPQKAEEYEEGYSKGKVALFIGILLIIIGGGSLGALTLLKKQNPNQVIIKTELPALFTTEYKDELNVSNLAKDTFVKSLAGKINDIQIPVNNFYNTYITTGSSTSQRRLISSAEFINLSKFKIPDPLKRSLSPFFMIGSYSLDGNSPFLILKTNSFEIAYAGMLEWEKTLERDFRQIFYLEGYETITSLAESLSPTNVIKKFEDRVINNKDVRLIKKTDGKIMLLYGIIDKETIIITTSDWAFKEIIDRLNREKSLKK